MSDVTAALGISQMDKLSAFVKKRRYLANRYFSALTDLPLKLPDPSTLDDSAWHLFVVELLAHDRADIYHKLHARGIGVNVHYIPVHWQPYYRDLGFNKGDFPNAEKYYNRALTLPLFPTLKDAEQDQVIQILHEVLS